MNEVSTLEKALHERLTYADPTTSVNPFRTPEHYFDQFPERLMAKLPDTKKQSAITHAPLTRRLVTRWAVAAMFTGCVATASLFSIQYFQDKRIAIEAESYIEDELDYMMIDNTEIAYFLTEADEL